MEAQGLASALAELSGCRVLSVAESNGPFDASAWPGVAAGDVAYWRPESLGEALFNYWD